MSGWAWFWLLWFLIAMIVFAIGETLAILNPEFNDTLSENVRLLMQTPWKIPFMIAFIGVFGWLIIHWFIEKNPQVYQSIVRFLSK